MSDALRTVRVITDSDSKQRGTVARQSDGLYVIKYAELFCDGWRITSVEGGLTLQDIRVRFPDADISE